MAMQSKLSLKCCDISITHELAKEDYFTGASTERGFKVILAIQALQNYLGSTSPVTKKFQTLYLY